MPDTWIWHRYTVGIFDDAWEENEQKKAELIDARA